MYNVTLSYWYNNNGCELVSFLLFDALKDERKRCDCGLSMVKTGGTIRSEECYIRFYCGSCHREDLYDLTGRWRSGGIYESHFSKLRGVSYRFSSFDTVVRIDIEEDAILIETSNEQGVVSQSATIKLAIADDYHFLLYNDGDLDFDFYPNNYCAARLELGTFCIGIENRNDAINIERYLHLPSNINN